MSAGEQIKYILLNLLLVVAVIVLFPILVLLELAKITK